MYIGIMTTTTAKRTTTKKKNTTGPVIQHLDDIHKGKDTFGITNPETGETRANESLDNCLTFAIDQALERDVDAVIIPGDIWDNGRPSAEHISQIIDHLKRLTNAGIPVIAEDGNHGRHHVRSHNRGPAELLRNIGVTVYDKVGMHTLDTKAGPLHVLGVPWPERARLLHEAGAEEVPLEQRDDVIAAYIADLIDDEMDAADIGQGEKLIVASHVTVSSEKQGLKLERGSEEYLNPRGVFEEVIMPLDALIGTGADYVALGHIHHHQDLGNATYAGSLNRLSFGEAEEEKGALFVTLNDDGPTREFVPTPALDLLNLDLGKNPEPDLSEITPGTLVKIFEGEKPVTDALKKDLAKAGATLLRVEPKKVTHHITGGRIKEGLTIPDAARQWADHEGLNKTMTETVLANIARHL